MAFLSPALLLLLVAFLGIGKSTADSCAENGGVCIPVNSEIYCEDIDGECPYEERCCLELISPASCENYTEIYGLEGSVVVPNNGLLTYQDNLYCEWIIEVPFGYWIYVNIITLDLEGIGYYCYWDYLEFSDASEFPQWYGQRLCGNQEYWLPSLEATTNRIRVVFRTDATVVKTGFSFNWTAIPIPTTPAYVPSCPSSTNETGLYGIVTVPDNGDPTYQNSQFCQWSIEVPPGFGILINILSFELEGPYSYCPWDYLEFFSSIPSFQWQSGKLCGSIYQIPTNFTLPTNQLSALFVSDYSVVYSGFSFTWTAVEIGPETFTWIIPPQPTIPEYSTLGPLLAKKAVKDSPKKSAMKNRKTN